MGDLRCYLLRDKNLATYGTLASFGQTGRLTSRGNGRYYLRCVCGLFYRLGSRFATDHASAGLDSFFFTGCFFGDHTIIPCVGDLRRYLLRDKNLATYGTLAAFGQTGCFACGGNSRYYFRRVSSFFNGLGSRFSADRAGEGLNTFFFAGSRFCDFSAVPCMRVQFIKRHKCYVSTICKVLSC